MTTKARVTWTVVALTLAASPSVMAGGFDRAIHHSLPRVVKLYGLGAGLQKGFGTGVLVSADGLVLTVYSLLVDADTVRAVTAEGTVFEARLVSHDRQRQLSLLRLTPLQNQPADQTARNPRRGLASPTVETPESDAESPVGPFAFFDVRCARESTSPDEPCGPELRPGDWVLAAGNAFKVADGAEPVSITHGVFSARTRLDARRRMRDFPYDGDVLVIDAITSNPGEPGAPLVNLDGEFVGLVGREVVSNLTHTHFNYAIPRDVVAAFVVDALSAERQGRYVVESPDELLLDEAVDPGIRVATAGFQNVLPFVERVVRGSPAQRAGVRKDDLVLSVNGRNVASADEYYKIIRSLRPGESINLVLRRDRRILTVQIGVPQRDGE